MSGPHRAKNYAVPVVQADGPYHINNLVIEEMFFTARNRYLELLGVDELWSGPILPLVRELVTRFDAEVSPGEELVVNTSVVSRSTRAFVMEQQLDRGGGDGGGVVATCRSVHVCVHKVAGAVPLPDDLWDAIVNVEGPLLERS